MLSPPIICKSALAFGLALSLSLPLSSAQGAAKDHAFTTLYSFKGGADGSGPNSALIFDKMGNAYGTTFGAGGGSGLGTVFKLAPDGAKTTLHTFVGGANDGASPSGQLLLDKAGILYGTTSAGGHDDCTFGGQPATCGTVFRIAPDGTETIFHFFDNSEGYFPQSGVIADKAGNLYGTTYLGGNSFGGTVFKLAPDGTETILHNFSYAVDGAALSYGLLLDEKGNLFGTASDGGSGQHGTLFKIAKDGGLTVLHSFNAASDGWRPSSALVADPFGNLYGTTEYGPGTSSGFGLIYELASDGTYEIEYAFESRVSGIHPMGGLIVDDHRHLFAVVPEGGKLHYPACGGCGLVFEFNGSEKVLHFFDGSDGDYPMAGLTKGPGGFLYGTTFEGGANKSGTIFKIKK